MSKHFWGSQERDDEVFDWVVAKYGKPETWDEAKIDEICADTLMTFDKATEKVDINPQTDCSTKDDVKVIEISSDEEVMYESKGKGKGNEQIEEHEDDTSEDDTSEDDTSEEEDQECDDSDDETWTPKKTRSGGSSSRSNVIKRGPPVRHCILGLKCIKLNDGNASNQQVNKGKRKLVNKGKRKLEY